MKLALIGLLAFGSFANASVRIGNLKANSCEILAPFKLKPAEMQTLAQKGYTVRVSRGSFESGRFLGIYDIFEARDGAYQDGDLVIKAVKSNPSGESFDDNVRDGHDVPKREFTVRVALGRGGYTVGYAYSVAPSTQASAALTNNADFRQLPDCR